MSTAITAIFDGARQIVPAVEPNFFRYIESFEKLKVGKAVWHGQINLAKDMGYIPQGAWTVTIYLLPTRRKAQAVGFQHRGKTALEAMAEVERLTQEWALNQEAITP